MHSEKNCNTISMGIKCGANYFLSFFMCSLVSHVPVDRCSQEDSTPIEYIESRQIVISELLCEDNVQAEDSEDLLSLYVLFIKQHTGQNLGRLVNDQNQPIMPYRARDSPA